MAIKRVKIYKVGEQQPTLAALEPFEYSPDAVRIVRGVARSEVPAGEQIIDFADGRARHARRRERVDQRLAGRLDRIVATVLGAFIRTRLSHEGARDHT